MTKSKSCFVVMPIRREGTPEYTHFRALYEEILKPIIEGLGYVSHRADDFKKGGAITKDIIIPLAEADLVVADLTDLNPNVFYELGVRHSLRGQGTVMIIDESRSEVIPFDVGAYRVIRFKGDLSGLGKLRRELESFILDLDPADLNRRDNPVHDWLPALPLNALEATKGSIEGSLREELSRLQRKMRDYEEKYGIVTEGRHASVVSPLDTVMEAIQAAKDGNLPSDLLSQAEAAVARRDNLAFLDVVRRALELRSGRLSGTQFLSLAGYSMNLGLDEVAKAVFDHASTIHPSDRQLIKSQLENFAHSPDPALRERARQGIIAELGMRVTDNEVIPPERLERAEALMLGVMLDAYLEDGLVEQALKMTEAFMRKFSHMSVIVRNHGRTLEKKGEDALEWYRRALWCSDADDVSAIWLGTELHNRERHVDAAEAYVNAAMRDPDDARAFAHVADELAWAITEEAIPFKLSQARRLPDRLDAASIEQILLAALSCRLLRETDIERCSRAAARVGIDFDVLGRGTRMTRGERIRLARELYDILKSDLTNPENAAWPPLAPGALDQSVQ